MLFLSGRVQVITLSLVSFLSLHGTWQMKMDSWEQLMEVVDLNGDGKLTIEELERYPFLFFLNLYLPFYIYIYIYIYRD